MKFILRKEIKVTADSKEELERIVTDGWKILEDTEQDKGVKE